MSFDVFLCHNSKDKPAVRALGERLRDAGFRPWLDEWELKAGQRFRKELEAQLVKIPAAAVLVGADGMGPWQDLEIDVLLSEMIGRGCCVIPVLLDSCPAKPELPPFLRAVVWVDFRETNPDPFSKLICGIRAALLTDAGRENLALPLNNLPASLGDLFAGRQELMAELEKSLVGHSGATALVQAQTVSGLGGVGKTRLAIELAHRHAGDFSAIFLVNADSPSDLRRNLAVLAGRLFLDLGLPETFTEDRVVEEVMVALRKRPGWLLILDNVDSHEAQAAVKSLLPLLQGGQVLITSRLQHWPASFRQLIVDNLDPASARDFLLKATAGRPRGVDDAGAAAKLAEKLGYLPLALELTAAYVRENAIGLAELVEGWAREEKKLLGWLGPGATEYPRSLAATWARTFGKLNSEAQALLFFLSHLAPEPIPAALLEAYSRWNEGEADLGRAGRFRKYCASLLARVVGNKKPFKAKAGQPAVLGAALADLQRYSLIRREGFEKQRSVTLHPLVQAVARGRISAEEKSIWVERTLQVVLGAASGDPSDVGTWPIWGSLRAHATRALELAEELGAPHPAVVLMNELGLFLFHKAFYVEAEPLLRRALAIAEADFGRDHPRVAVVLNNLVLLLQATNRPTEAEPLVRRALVINETSLGRDTLEVACNLNNLAWLLRETNQLGEAESVLRRALAIAGTSFDPGHPGVAILGQLGQLLQATNRFAEAEPLLRQALAIDEPRFGAYHPNVAHNLTNLGLLLRETNRLAEAEPLMRRALKINEKIFGQVHPRVSLDLDNLAIVLQATRRFAEAEPLMRRALAIDETIFGPIHPRVAVDLNNLATLLQDTNRLGEAEPLMRRALAIDESGFSQDHPNVAHSLNNLATLLHTTNRPAEAEPLLRRALVIDENSFGPNHPNVAMRLSNLAQLLKDTNRFTEAEPLMRRALAIDETSFGPDHPSVARGLNNLALLLQETNRLAAAEPLLRRALAIFEGSLGPGHPWAVNCGYFLVILLEKLAKARQ